MIIYVLSNFSHDNSASLSTCTTIFKSTSLGLILQTTAHTRGHYQAFVSKSACNCLDLYRSIYLPANLPVKSYCCDLNLPLGNIPVSLHRQLMLCSVTKYKL